MDNQNKITEIIEENRRRNAELAREFDPVSGMGSTGSRFRVGVSDIERGALWLPESMRTLPEIKILDECGSMREYARRLCGHEPSMRERELAADRFSRLRALHDFPYWAATRVFIKSKLGGEDVLFRLNRPQRKFVERLEKMRTGGKPVRLILLKARQWGGSTCAQLYMAWLQLVHSKGLNSLIIAHQGVGSDEIKDMFDRMIGHYPDKFLVDEGETPDPKARRTEGVGRSRQMFRVPSRNCKIKIGTAERPDSCRGGDYSLVHCSEVGIWKATLGKTPEQILRSACSGVLLKPMTMIVYESTANGTGNFFHREYDAAKRGLSQFESMFVAWYEIDQYSAPVADTAEFASRLLAGRECDAAENDRSQPGRYLWWLWERGATLEAISWYISERSKYSDHGLMAAEYPSDDVEAFVHSGARVFDRYRVEELRAGCRAATHRGEIDVPGAADAAGRGVSDRERAAMLRGEGPEIVAQWRGHTDFDLLAWRAAMASQFYGRALLVIESNTLETRDPDRDVDGDQSGFILNRLREVYPNLYARRQSEEAVRMGAPVRYGFHTNISTKPAIVATLVKVIREGLYTERDQNCLDEYLSYERRPNGSYGAIAGCHDDLLMTRAIGLHICFHEMDPPRRTQRAVSDFHTYATRRPGPDVLW